jgi:hypothetical protein
MQQCVQFAVLAQIAANNTVAVDAVALRCPQADRRDIARALDILFEEGCVEEPIGGVARLTGTNESDRFHLSEAGRQRLTATEESKGR